MVDYLIVGLGLAGIPLCDILEENNRDFLVFDDASQQSSTVAGGLYNPVVLKRFTKVWKAEEQLNIALQLYKKLEEKLKVKLDYKEPLYRRFASVSEQNNWFEASDNPNLQPYLSTQLIKNTHTCIKANYGYGEVLDTGRINTYLLQNEYKKYLANKFKDERFDYSFVELKDDYVLYKGIKARRIVFAEGFGLVKNPFFNWIKLKVAKGELLTIKAPELKIDFVLKSSVFVIPLGNDLYRVGATYEWEDITNRPSEKGKKELLEKLNTFLNCNYEVVDHVAGIRPIVADRKPLTGVHPEHSNLYVLNGLGTRGVMIGPYVADKLYNFIENKIPLEKEINIQRLKKQYKASKTNF